MSEPLLVRKEVKVELDGTIGIGLAALGMSGRVFHAPLLKNNPHFRIRRVMERSKNKANRFLPGIPLRGFEEKTSRSRLKIANGISVQASGTLSVRKVEWIDDNVAYVCTPPRVCNMQKAVRTLYDSRVGKLPLPSFQQERITPCVPLVG